jgi:hypothetical protein
LKVIANEILNDLIHKFCPITVFSNWAILGVSCPNPIGIHQPTTYEVHNKKECKYTFTSQNHLLHKLLLNKNSNARE